MPTPIESKSIDRKPRGATANLSKAAWNFLVDGGSLAVFAALIATGLMMEYRLPSGEGRGRGLELLGMNRHDWGEIHFWLAVALIAMILLHLALHWRWIWAMAQGRDPAHRRRRGIAFLVVTALLLSIVALPWAIHVKSVDQRGGGGGRARVESPREADPAIAAEEPAREGPRRLRLRGGAS